MYPVVEQGAVVGVGFCQLYSHALRINGLIHVGDDEVCNIFRGNLLCILTCDNRSDILPVRHLIHDRSKASVEHWAMVAIFLKLMDGGNHRLTLAIRSIENLVANLIASVLCNLGVVLVVDTGNRQFHLLMSVHAIVEVTGKFYHVACIAIKDTANSPHLTVMGNGLTFLKFAVGKCFLTVTLALLFLQFFKTVVNLVSTMLEFHY